MILVVARGGLADTQWPVLEFLVPKGKQPRHVYGMGPARAANFSL